MKPAPSKYLPSKYLPSKHPPSKHQVTYALMSCLFDFDPVPLLIFIK
ncbi:MAG: hypothetical protein N838_04440 [Thiohalocapsa sp. PB-PSB1]|nr:MAG: hypothetical protein N838_04440 [Thiohalocapsa sp. PB-PSB1]